MAPVPMGDLLRYHAQRKPENALAVSIAEQSVTWWELERRANRRARYFRERGVKRDDWVTIVTGNSVRLCELVFALWKLGATPNIVSPRLAPKELEAIVGLADPRLVLADSGLAVGRDAIDVDSDASQFDDGPMDALVARHWKVLASGGSTGRPKLIVDHRPAEFDPKLSLLDMPIDGVALAPGPLSHNAPFGSIFGAIFVGSHAVGMTKFDPEGMLQLIERHRVNWTSIVPTMMHRVWSLPPEVRERYDLSSLRTVWHSAAAIAPWLKEAWMSWLGPERIFEMYGGTEGIGFTTISGAEWLRKKGSVGKPYGATRLKVLREDGSQASAGEIGEICFLPLDPDNPSYHYVGAQPRRVSDLESFGDMGWLDEDGYLFLADRRSDLIIRGGVNVYPAEIEAALDAYPSIRSAIVVGLPDEDLGSTVHAIVQIEPGSPPDVDALNAHLRQSLSTYKIPESYEWVDAPLRDVAGKARRSALKEERVAWLKEGRPFTAWKRGKPG